MKATPWRAEHDRRFPGDPFVIAINQWRSEPGRSRNEPGADGGTVTAGAASGQTATTATSKTDQTTTIQETETTAENSQAQTESPGGTLLGVA